MKVTVQGGRSLRSCGLNFHPKCKFPVTQTKYLKPKVTKVCLSFSGLWDIRSAVMKTIYWVYWAVKSTFPPWERCVRVVSKCPCLTWIQEAAVCCAVAVLGYTKGVCVSGWNWTSNHLLKPAAGFLCVKHKKLHFCLPFISFRLFVTSRQNVEGKHRVI